jgi:hypothetical protein
LPTNVAAVGTAYKYAEIVIPTLFIYFQKTYPILSYFSVAMVIGFVIGFATGPGSIPWFFVTELFTQSGRPMATSIAVVTNWSANFLVGLLFAPALVREDMLRIRTIDDAHLKRTFKPQCFVAV